MKLKLLAASAACWGALAASGAVSAQNLVRDGAFDNASATYAENVTGAFGSAAAPSAWTVTRGNVDVVGGYWQSPSGANAAGQPAGVSGSVDLDGTTAGAISQTFMAPTDGQYVLTFDLSSNPDAGSNDRSVDVSIDSQTPTDFSYLDKGHDKSDMAYTSERLVFTATAGENTLSFASLEGGSYGAVIGDVSIVALAGDATGGGGAGGVSGAGSAVSAAPEPGTWALMFAGVAMAGGALRRSRRLTSQALA